jgi:hypothetical protein
MSMTSEEQALRSALADAVGGQPAAPYDRIDGVRRRHARRRQRQLTAMGVGAVVAVTGATLGVLGIGTRGGDNAQLAKRDVPSWALSWPDNRDRSIPQPVLDGAVEAWSHDAGLDTATTATAQQVIWYRAAKVADGSDIVVMFEVVSEYGNQLVVGQANADQVIDGQPGYDVENAETPWILAVVDAPKPSSSLVFGLNTPYSRSQGTHVVSDNVAIVMADPRARSVEWHVTGADKQVRRAVSALSSGFAAIDTGEIRDRVRIDAVRDGHGKVLAHDLGVGVPGNAESYRVQLAQVPEFPDVPDSPVSLGQASGQGNLQGESESDGPWPMNGTTIYARCYGGPSIVISIDSEKPGHRVRIPCDDREHVVDGPPVLAHSELASEGTEDSNGNYVPIPPYPGPPNPPYPVTQNHAYMVAASDDTAWRVAVNVH